MDRDLIATMPPGPDLAPEQQARLWIERPLDLLEGCARAFGDAFTLQLGALGATAMFSHPEAVRTIFRTPSDRFECRHFNESYRFVMGDNALFLRDGEGHRRLKRVMMPMLCHEGMGALASTVREIAAGMLDRAPVGEPVAVRPLMHELALRVLMALVFGERREAGERVLGWFRSEVWRDQRSWKPWMTLNRLQPRLRALIAEEVAFRRDGGGAPGRAPDLLDHLIAARDEEGRPLEPVELQDQVLTLTITAVDPVGFAMAWMLDWVSRMPAVQSALRDEVAALGADPDPVAVMRLPYLTATCQEVLRIHPILPTVSGRRLTEPMELSGYRLPPGVNVAACAYLVHRREELYPEPRAFRPERFLSRRFAPHEYFPFGGGDRHCLGTSMAPMEMRLVLATFVSRRRIVPGDGAGPDVRYGTLVGPPGELKIGLEAL